MLSVWSWPRIRRRRWRREQVKQYVRYGSSPRGVQSLVLAGKVRALFQGRFHVSFEDIRAVALACLRHRLILNFEGEAEGIDSADLTPRHPGTLARDKAVSDRIGVRCAEHVV